MEHGGRRDTGDPDHGGGGVADPRPGAAFAGGRRLRVFASESGKRGLIQPGTRKPDLLILDLGLPNLDGVELIKDLRGWSGAPALILSARSNEQDKVTAPKIVFGETEIDFSKRTVVRRGEQVRLPPFEFRLVTVLAANAGKAHTHRRLMRAVWGPAYAESTHYLRIYVSHLREKLEDDPAQPAHFFTETGAVTASSSSLSFPLPAPPRTPTPLTAPQARLRQDGCTLVVWNRLNSSLFCRI